MAIPETTHKSFAEIAEDTANLIHGDLWPIYNNNFGDALLADFWLDRHTDRNGVSQVMLKLNRGDRELEPADRRFVFRRQGIVGRPIVVRDTLEGTDPSWSLLADCKARDWDTQARQYLLDTLYLPNAVAAEWIQRNCNQNIEAAHPTKKKERRGRPSYDWEAVNFEVVRIANSPDGLPEKQGDLERVILNWCVENWGFEPGESTVRGHISKYYDHLQSSDNG